MTKTQTKSKTCYALHGFLGKPGDWDILSTNGLGIQALKKIDILKEAVPSVGMGMTQWAKKFNASVKRDEGEKILLGYSMGGRLAFHALLEDPELWSCAILVSAHTGIKSLVDRAERQVQDEIWGQRFEQEPWDGLMTSWNSREIFVSKQASFYRQENQYLRTDLANILRYWSLGSQQELSELIGQLRMPILWVVGEDDRNYRERADRMTFSNPKSKIWIAPGAGHRVPWECNTFQQQVKQFLSDVT